jgi:c-di-GMP-binding flagellar brake protein YcgR
MAREGWGAMPAPLASLEIEHLFRIGAPVALEFERDDAWENLPSRVEESAADGLTVGMPLRMGMVVIVPVGATVRVIARRSDAAYIVPTRVVQHRNAPFPMLDVRPTGPIERRQQREFVRLPALITPRQVAAVGPKDLLTPLPAVVLDLSAGGLRLRSKRALSVGQPLKIVLDLPAPIGLLTAHATVSWVRQPAGQRDAPIEAGCRFVDLGQRERERLVRYILQTQAKQARAEDAR